MFKLFILFITFPSLLVAMNGSLTKYYVPGERESVGLSITAEQLCTIKSEQELKNEGILTAIVVRPENNYRTMVASAVITKNGLIGDKGPNPNYPNVYLTAVSLMRSDVSDALGGAHILGDNLHVERLSLSTENLKPGDLIVVSEPHDKQLVKMVLLMTHQPHTGCYRLEARVGKEAFNFINGMGKYEEQSLRAKDGQLLNGPAQRLRGVFLAVLKEGTPSLGDTVFIESGEQKDQRIAQLGLVEFCKKAIQDSKEAEEVFNKKEKIIREARRKEYQRTKNITL